MMFRSQLLLLLVLLSTLLGSPEAQDSPDSLPPQNCSDVPHENSTSCDEPDASCFWDEETDDYYNYTNCYCDVDVWMCYEGGWPVYDCADAPYENSTSCSDTNATCYWDEETEDYHNTTTCYCDDVDEKWVCNSYGWPIHDCADVPYENFTSCTVPDASCYWEDEKEDYYNYTSCYCNGDEWFCHSSGWPVYNCADEPYENATTCDVPEASCYWDVDIKDYYTHTHCFCSAEEDKWLCDSYGWPIHNCPAQPYKNATSCDVPDAYCHWNDETEFYYNNTNCHCNGEEWNCESYGWPIYTCADEPYENSTNCSVLDAYCYWQEETPDYMKETNCHCNGEKWVCYDYGWPIHDCPDVPYENATNCSAPDAYCYWNDETDDYFNYTDCTCSVDNEWICHYGGWPIYECSDVPYKNASACTVAEVYCHWDNETEDYYNSTGCYCDGEKWDCRDSGWPIYDCPDEPYKNSSSCSVLDAYCYWQDETVDYFNETSCYCDGEKWDCYKYGWPIYDCPDVPHKNATNCSAPDAYCYWDDETDDYFNYTDCTCSVDNEWICYDGGWPIYECSDVPYKNSSACSVAEVYCHWDNETEDYYHSTGCYCDGEKWDCHDSGWPIYNCPDEPHKNASSCSVLDAYCYWQNETADYFNETNCYCNGEKWDCYNWGYPIYDCPDEPYKNFTSCDVPDASCYWDDETEDYYNHTNCYCDVNKWVCDSYGWAIHDCADEPYKNSSTCTALDASCHWYHGTEDYFNETYCSCDGEKWNCHNYGWAIHNCAGEPYKNSSACTVPDAYCYWNNETKDYFNETHCYCDIDKWNCDNYGWPIHNCANEPYQNFSTCTVPDAYCYWNEETEDYYNETSCYCDVDKWNCYVYGWAIHDCADEPYKNSSTCTALDASCYWDEQTEDYHNHTSCYCDGVTWSCYNHGWPIYNCPDEPHKNSTSCSVQDAYCYWDEETEDYYNHTSCYCNVDETWVCDNYGWPIHDCPDEPYQNSTSCDVPEASCYWDDETVDYFNHTSCYCDGELDEWVCDSYGWPIHNCSDEPYMNLSSCSVPDASCYWSEETEDYYNSTSCHCGVDEMWVCDNYGYPIYDCPDVPFENSTECTVDEAYCYWYEEADDYAVSTDCSCLKDKWLCHESIWPINYNCSEVPYENMTSCDDEGAYCSWGNETWYHDCYCDDTYWNCYESIDDETDGDEDVTNKDGGPKGKKGKSKAKSKRH